MTDVPDALPRDVDIQAATDLCSFIDASPSPFHGCAEMAGRLRADGFVEFSERDVWAVEPGTAGYIIRDGTIVAFRVGTEPVAETGFRLIGAHTDSPTYRVRPNPMVSRAGYGQISVEVYGGPLAYTWLDRDLGLAGRVVTSDGQTHLVHLDQPLLRIPSLAIHLNRELNENGLQLNPQNHIVPVFAAAAGDLGLPQLLGDAVDGDVAGWDLMLCDTQASSLGGVGRQFVFAPRQDNLVSCHAAIRALLAADVSVATQIVICNDHEEVGSGSAEGAAGPMLAETLTRLVAASGDTDPQSISRAVAGSILVSSDSAHAVHPNYADKHDGGHRPRLGGGPAIKTHASQAYATDAGTLVWFRNRCESAGVPVQYFSNRADSRSGSTIGPLTATRLGIPTVDIGNPLLSMHSVREQSATVDVLYLVAALRDHLMA